MFVTIDKVQLLSVSWSLSDWLSCNTESFGISQFHFFWILLPSFQSIKVVSISSILELLYNLTLTLNYWNRIRQFSSYLRLWHMLNLLNYRFRSKRMIITFLLQRRSILSHRSLSPWRSLFIISSTYHFFVNLFRNFRLFLFLANFFFFGWFRCLRWWLNDVLLYWEAFSKFIFYS